MWPLNLLPWFLVSPGHHQPWYWLDRRLSQCQWSNPEGYGQNNQFWMTTKHNKGRNLYIILVMKCALLRTREETNGVKKMEGVKLILNGLVPPILTWINFIIPAWISNYIRCKVWIEITYPLPNFNSAATKVWEWRSNFIPHFIGHVITYSCQDLS